MNRRGFLLGLGGGLAAPAIVRVASIMPITPVTEPEVYYAVAHLDGSTLTVEYLLRATEILQDNAIERIDLQKANRHFAWILGAWDGPVFISRDPMDGPPR